MIEHVVIENYRCLPRLAAKLRPLTVLIGPNDTGKSAFLSAIKTLFTGGPISELDHWKLALANVVGMQARTRNHAVTLHPVPGGPFGRTAPGPGAPGPGGGGVVHQLFGSRERTSEDGSAARTYKAQVNGKAGLDPALRVALFDLPSTGLSMWSEGHADQGVAPEFGPRGEGVPALLDYLLRRDRRRFEEFVGAMQNRVPGLEDVQVATPDAHTRRLDLLVDGGLTIPGDKVSVGVRLMLFFVALSYHPSPPDVILLEEPENGVHPRRLAGIMKLLREITQGVHCGHKAQVILSTHSPYLLDHVDLEQDQVLVFHRNDDGSRTAEPVDAKRLKTFLDDFMLGEVWFNEQEEGLIKRGD